MCAIFISRRRNRMLIKSMATRHFNEKFAQYNIVFLQELLYQYSCFKNIRIKRIIGVLCK